MLCKKQNKAYINKTNKTNKINKKINSKKTTSIGLHELDNGIGNEIDNEIDNNKYPLPSGIVSDITQDIIQYVSNIVYHPTNKVKIKNIFNYLINSLLEHIFIYLYTIMALLIIIFVMNCSQFYYIINKS